QGTGPGAQGNAVGDAVQPGADRLPLTDRAGLAGQREERGLEGVLGVLRVAQDPPAHTEHHRAVPPHQQLERRLVPLGDEALEELGVRNDAGVRPPAVTAQIPDDGWYGLNRHGPPVASWSLSTPNRDQTSPPASRNFRARAEKPSGPRPAGAGPRT